MYAEKNISYACIGLCLQKILQSIAFFQHFLPSSKVSSKFWSWKFFQHSFRVQRRRRVKTYIRRQSKNVWDLKLTLLKGNTVKRQCHAILDFSLFSKISVPKAPEYPTRAVSNFLRKFLRSSSCFTGVIETGGKWKKSSIKTVLNFLFGHLRVAEVTYR